jgi:hypothetical protein
MDNNVCPKCKKPLITNVFRMRIECIDGFKCGYVERELDGRTYDNGERPKYTLLNPGIENKCR